MIWDLLFQDQLVIQNIDVSLSSESLFPLEPERFEVFLDLVAGFEELRVVLLKVL